MGGHVSSFEIDVDDVTISLLEFARNDGSPLFAELHQDFVQRPAQTQRYVLGERGKLTWSSSGRYSSIVTNPGNRSSVVWK
jgi:hypothetical protein